MLCKYCSISNHIFWICICFYSLFVSLNMYVIMLVSFLRIQIVFSFYSCVIVNTYRQTSNEPIPITINKISMTDYETHHYDNELLRQSATFFATIKFHAMTDLEQIRKTIETYCEENANTPKLLPDWCFLDCK